MASSNDSPKPEHSTRSLSAPGTSSTSNLGADRRPDNGLAGPPDAQTTLKISDIGSEDLRDAELDSYRLGRRLGSGGMGVVYKARHRLLGKSFALKFIHGDSARSDDARSRFIQEFKALGRLNHPHIVSAVDAGSVEDVFYYVTELLSGRDLSQWRSARGTPSVGAACEALRQSALGLHHAHEHGFVHRDVKPSNIFLNDDGLIKILDFGLVRDRESSGSVTRTGDLIGTVDYFSPEQAEDFRSCTATADIYSLGATAIYLFSGDVPYPDRDYPSIVSKLRGHMTSVPQWLKAAEETLPTDLSRLLHCMMAHRSNDRPQSCREVAETLSRWASPQELAAWMAGTTPSVAPPCSVESAGSTRSNVRKSVAIWSIPVGLAAAAAGAVILHVIPEPSQVVSGGTSASVAPPVIGTPNDPVTDNPDVATALPAAIDEKSSKDAPQATMSVPSAPPGKPVTVSRNERKPQSAKPIQLDTMNSHQAKLPLGPITRSPRN